MYKKIIVTFIALISYTCALYAQTSAIPTTMDVNAIGASTYSIPIEVVPGTNGMHPSLAITYNSLSGHSQMGIHWGLQGLSSITRCTQTNYYDGNIQQLTFNIDDRFSLDGKRMVLLKGERYYSSDALYAFEIDDLSRIQRVERIDGSFYFVDTLADGHIVEYGATNDACQMVNGKVLSWMMNKITDANNNYITYHYSQSDGEIWIDHIDYTFNAQALLTSAYASIQFDYRTAASQNELYVVSGSVKQSKLLEKIIVSYGNDQVRKYFFTYNEDWHTARLTEISLLNADDVEISATQIKWDEIPDMTSYGALGLPNGFTVVTGNFDKDRIYDILAINGTETRLYKREHDESYNIVSSTSTVWSCGAPDPNSFSSIDIDNDGVDELVYCNQNGQYVYAKVTASANSLTLNSDYLYQGNLTKLGAVWGDYDGDGKPEAVIPVSSVDYVFCYGFESAQSHLVYDIDTGFIAVASGDFDGDGISELITIDKYTYKIWSYNNFVGRWFRASSGTMPAECLSCLSGDLNGDGITDLVMLLNYSGTGVWVAAIKQGTTSNFLYTEIPEMNSEKKVDTLIIQNDTHFFEYAKYPALLCDFNCDGKIDILQAIANSQVNVFLSKGCLSGNYIYIATGFENYSSQPFFTPAWGQPKAHFTIGDIDGNGTPDIVLNNSNPGGVHPSAIYFYKGSMAGNYVSRITDAMGKTVRFEYSTLSLMQERFSGLGMKWMPLPVVKNLLVSNGIGGFDTTAFFYGDAQFHKKTYQFIGFGHFGKRNNGHFTEYAFSRVPRVGSYRPFETLLPDSILVWTTPSNPYSTPALYSDGTAIWHTSNDIKTYKTQNQLSSMTRPSASGTTLFIPYISATIQINFLTNSKTETSTTLNSSTWLPESQSTLFKYNTGSDEVPKTETVNYRYATTTLDNGAKIPQVSRTESLTSNSSNANLYRQNLVVRNYTQGRVTEETATDNCGRSVTTTYTYTPAGTPLRVTTTPYGESPRYNEYYYDATYRFVEMTSDQSLYSEQREYDGATGNLTKTTDVNGLTTTFAYDDWNRLVRTTFPDGTVRETTFTAGAGGFMRVKMYATTTESGKPLTRVYYDALGRKRHSYVAGSGYSDIVYDKLGQITRRTAIPYSSVQADDDTKLWQTFSYDIYGRTVKDSSFYHKNTYGYSGTQYNQQSYLFSKSASDRLGATSTTYYDAAERVVKVVDNGGTVDYRYGMSQRYQGVCDSMTISSGGNTTAIVTDSRGNRLSLSDPDAGTITSTYNGWNELTSQTDANGNTTALAYDNQGRVVSKTYSTGNETDSYSYTYNSTYTQSSRGKGKLASVAHNNSAYCSLTYDRYGRVSSLSKTIDGNTYTHQYSYYNNGKLHTKTYPDGFGIRYIYDSDGRVEKIENLSTGAMIYNVIFRNGLGQPTMCWFGNSTGVIYHYNSYGLPTTVKYGYKVLDDPPLPPVPFGDGDGMRTDPGGTPYTVDDHYSVLDYTYNANGYITHKGDSKTGQYEDYIYDALGRLTQYSVNNSISYSFNYDGGGNMTRNTKVSPYYYSYDAQQPHAVSGVDANTGTISSAQCDVTYNSRNRPAAISENGWLLQLAYNDEQQRESAALSYNTAPVSTTHFISKDCEREMKSLGNRYLDYIRVDGRTVAVHVKNGNADSIYYVQSDLLGSWDRVVDESRNVVQSSHFDPWGNRMSASDWTLAQDGTSLPFHRGFTGHEHYDRFGIINMNARLYDPVIGRFFSPDPQVQSPFSTQGLNRYSYCGNNPVMYIDEDGEFVWLPVIAAAIGGLINVGINIANGNLSGCGFWETLGRGTVAFLGGAAQGAAACFGPGWSSLGGALAGGINSWLGGGNFIAGAVTGGISSALGYVSGQWASQASSILINGFNITSPVFKGVIGGIVGGGSSGFISNFIAAGMSNDWNLQQAYQSGLQGLYYGSLMGSVSGGVAGYKYAYDNNINPWTGTYRNSVMIGEGMDRVSTLSRDMNVSTIEQDWPEGVNAYDPNGGKPNRILNSDAMDFNSKWIEIQMEQKVVIYDIGPYNGSTVASPFYNMEIGRTMDYKNVQYIRIILYRKYLRIVVY
ncbi:MAG: VCBS repeat-containing protein [Bacteroidales bacterium]|nr:VCBS repeat-containing protein [Bacteroidales bacterium]